MAQEFAKWKKQVDVDYEEWKRNKNPETVINYFKNLCEQHECLNIAFENFKIHLNNLCVESNNEMIYEAAYIKYVILSQLLTEDKIELNGVTIGEVEGTNKLSSALAIDSTIKKAICQSGYFSMGRGTKEHWINFCSAFHKLFPKLFNTWDDVNDFCLKCCRKKNGDNYLYVRNLEDVCIFYTIIRGEAAGYKKELFKKAKRLLDKCIKDKEKAKKEEGWARTATLKMIEEINKEKDISNYIRANLHDFLYEDNYSHTTAIKKILEELGHEKDNGEGKWRQYGSVWINYIYDPIIRLFDKAIANCRNESEENLKTKLLSEIIPRYKDIDVTTEINVTEYAKMLLKKIRVEDVVKREQKLRRERDKLLKEEETLQAFKRQNISKTECAKIEKKLINNQEELNKKMIELKAIEYEATSGENKSSIIAIAPIFNKVVRNVSIVIRMWKLQKESNTYRKTRAIEKINNFLLDCKLRIIELDNLYDDFDWFVMKALEHEQDLYEAGEREYVAGFDTLMQYLCEG